MRSPLCAAWLVLVMSACSAQEGANDSQRCDDNTFCSPTQVCYRGFCIQGDGPGAVELDASQSPSTDPGPTGPSVESDAASVVGGDVDSAVTKPVDWSLSDGSQVLPDSSVDVVEAGAGPTVPADPTNPVDPTEPVDPTVPTDPTTPTDPPPAQDAGQPVVDAGRMSSGGGPEQFLLCLPACSNSRSFRCLRCLSDAQSADPSVCNGWSRASNPQQAWLCEILCGQQDCGDGK